MKLHPMRHLKSWQTYWTWSRFCSFLSALFQARTNWFTTNSWKEKVKKKAQKKQSHSIGLKKLENLQVINEQKPLKENFKKRQEKFSSSVGVNKAWRVLPFCVFVFRNRNSAAPSCSVLLPPLSPFTTEALSVASSCSLSLSPSVCLCRSPPLFTPAHLLGENRGREGLHEL